MINPWALRGVTLAAGIVLCGSLAAADAQHHVSLKVTLDNGSDYKKIKGSGEKSRSEKCLLHITVDNRDNVPVKNLSVRWTIYGKAVGKDKLMPAGQATKYVTVPALKTVQFNSTPVSFNGTPKHGETTTSKSKGASHAKTQTTEFAATGTEYYGYAVQIYDGGVLIDQAYSQNRLRDGN